LPDAGVTTITESLSGGCNFFLGRGLDKGEQLSNWDQRPLTIDQMRYAALDAHSLLAIFDSIMTCLRSPDTSSGALALYSDAVKSHVTMVSEAVAAKDATTLQRLANTKKSQTQAEAAVSAEIIISDGGASTAYTESTSVDTIDTSCDEDSPSLSSPPPLPQPNSAKKRTQKAELKLTSESWTSFIH
jgi:hypothetical protein